MHFDKMGVHLDIGVFEICVSSLFWGVFLVVLVWQFENGDTFAAYISPFLNDGSSLFSSIFKIFFRT